MAEETKETVLNIEIGGLRGRTFIKEAKRHPDQRFLVIGPEAAPLAKVEIPSNLTYRQVKEEESIPLPNASTDRVLIEQVFSYVEPAKFWRPLFSEASRILKSGGQLKIIDLKCNENEIRLSLPHYGFTQVKTRPLREEEKSEITKTLAMYPERYSKPISITAKKV